MTKFLRGQLILEYRRVMLSIMAASLFLCSCFNTGMPPGFEKNGGPARAAFPKGTSSETIFLVLSWYIEAHREDMSAEMLESVTSARLSASSDLFRKWSLVLLQRGAPLIRLEKGNVELVPSVFSQNLDVDQGLRMIKDIRNMAREPIALIPSTEEAMSPAIWRKNSKSQREAFSEWVLEQKKLPVPDPDFFDRKKLMEDLDSIESMVSLRKKLIDALKIYEQQPSDDVDAQKKSLDSLTNLKKSLPAGLSFEKIGDSVTLEKFSSVLEKLPHSCLSLILSANENLLEQEIRRIDGLDKSGFVTSAVISTLESDLSMRLKQTREDSKYGAALNKASSRINKLISDCANLRIRIWCSQIKDLGERKEYWDASEAFKTFIRQLDAQITNEMGLYNIPNISDADGKMYAAKIREETAAEYLKLLPLAYEDYLLHAERAANISNNHGISFALCMMLGQMSTLPNGIVFPENLSKVRKKAVDLLEKSRRLVEDNKIRRTVSIGEMSSATPGIGLTYGRDLENELKLVLESFGLSNQLVFPEPGAALSKWGYVTSGGRVANFDGNESSERLATKTIRRHTEVQRVPNPDYNANAVPPAPKKNTSPVMYKQDVLIQVIHVKEIERLAHVRVFMNFSGPGFTTPVEVNEFYNKNFSIEESHPFNDVKVFESKKYYDATLASPEDSEPVLRYDRVWTPGEMLDWARKDSLRMAALLLVYNIIDYPMYLAKKAERVKQDGDAAESTEIWSQCQIICQTMDTDSDLVAMMKTASPPAAKAYDACLKRFREQRQAIANLKREVPSKLFAQANAYLRKAREHQ